jgi:hypothetical protein
MGMILTAATMHKMGFQLVYTGGGFYTWEVYGPDRSALSLEAHAVLGHHSVGNTGCCCLPCGYSVYDSDGRFIGSSEEVVRSASRLRSIASVFMDRMLLMSKADRFGELINLVLTNEEANYTR